MDAWQNIEKAEEQFLTTLADHGGLASETGGMLRHCARCIDALRSEVERLREERDSYVRVLHETSVEKLKALSRAEAAEATLDDFIEAAEHYFNTGVADALRAVLNEKLNAQGDEGNG